jgi:uncharacterized protein
MLSSIEHRIADELGVKSQQVLAAVALLDDGATVPFIARYRKEITSGLDDTQLRTLEERLGYLRDLEERRAAILASIEEQGKLTPQLRSDIEAADTKQRLEDLYLPYKPKRRTKAQIAREAGLEPLAQALLADPMLVPEHEAGKFLRPAFTTADGDNPGVPDTKSALEGARHILIERFAEDAQLLGRLREHLHGSGVLSAVVVEGKKRVKSFVTTSPTARRSRTSRRIVRWPCFAAAAKTCCGSRSNFPKSWKKQAGPAFPMPQSA